MNLTLAGQHLRIMSDVHKLSRVHTVTVLTLAGYPRLKEAVHLRIVADQSLS